MSPDDDDNGVDTSATANAVIEDILSLLQEEAWEQAIDRTLHDLPRHALLPQSYYRFGGIAMGAASYKQSVPLEFYHIVIQMAGKESASYQDAGLRTPLHMALMYLDRPDICRFLVGTAPSTLNMRDHIGLRPIDILTQKILMKEERMRYLKKSNNNINNQNRDQQSQQQQLIDLEVQLLEDCWECARILCLAHGGELHSNPDLPLLHACCLGHRDVPLSLVHRALRKSSFQLQLQDDIRHETPLHILARQHVVIPDTNDDDDDNSVHEEEAEESDLLEIICNAYSQAASLLNNKSQYPLDIAIAAGRQWRTGCRCLTKAYPPALLNVIQSNGEYQQGERMFFQIFLLSHVHEEEFAHDLLFQVLRARPQIVFAYHEKSSR